MMSVGFHQIPQEVHVHIASFLSMQAVGRCMQLNKQCSQLYSCDEIWIVFAQQLFLYGGETLKPCTKKRLNEWFFTLHSTIELFCNIRSFLDRLQLGQNGRWRCFARKENCPKAEIETLAIEIKGNANCQALNITRDVVKFDVMEEIRFDAFHSDFASTTLNFKTPLDMANIHIMRHTPHFGAKITASRFFASSTTRTTITQMVESKLRNLEEEEERQVILKLNLIGLSLFASAATAEALYPS